MGLHEVQVLREVVTKLVPMIAGRGVRVTQMGAQAYVLTNKKTLKIERVNIPHIPDEADETLILAIQGFIDHEVGHVLDTDWKAVAGGAGVGREIAEEQSISSSIVIPRIMNLANMIEDPFVERCMRKRFPGTAWNLDKLYHVFIERMTKPALEKATSDADRLAILMVPLVRSIAGQKFFTDFMDAGKHWDEPLVKALVSRITPALQKEILTVKTSWDSLDIAKQLYHIIYPPPPPPPPTPPAKAPEEDEGSGTGSGKSERAGDGKASGKESDESDEELEAETRMSEEPPESPPTEESDDDTSGSGDDEDADEAGAPADTDTSPEADDEAGEADAPADEDVSTAEDDTADEGAGDEAEGDGEKDEVVDDTPEEGGAAEKPADDKADEVDAEDGDEEKSEEEKAAADGEDGDEGEGDGEADGDKAADEPSDAKLDIEMAREPSPFEEADVPLSKDLSEAIADLITDAATRETRGADYRVYTREWDVIEPLELGSDYQPAWLEALDSKTRHMVAPMQKEIERMMAARSQCVKVPGFRSGVLHGGSLHRLRVNDDRVFRRKQENHSTATAVSLVIDNSGSMGGSPGSKMGVATAAAYALSQTLERLKITHEVIGFTTGPMTSANCAEIRAEEARIGKTFSRSEAIYMPIYKGFDERLTADVRARFAKAFMNPNWRSQNIDGECVAIACHRLVRQREPRKVMLVLSDGEPACCSMHPAEIHSDLHKAVADTKKMGIEIVGIGIMSDAVARYYPKHIVLDSVEKLPITVMNELKRVLLSPNK